MPISLYSSLFNKRFTKSLGKQFKTRLINKQNHCLLTIIYGHHIIIIGHNSVKNLFIFISEAQPGLKTFVRYAKVELTPPTLGEMPKVSEGFQNLATGVKTGKWKTITVKVSFFFFFLPPFFVK